MDDPTTLSIEVWSDLACPWCYVGKRRLEEALRRDAGTRGSAVAVRWHAFELNPAAPRSSATGVPYAQRLAEKYSVPPRRAQGMVATMTEAAAHEGLAFDFERIRPGNTFDAHRLLAAAAEEGRDGPLRERLFRAYLCEGEALDEHATLLRLAADVGLDATRARATLTGHAFAADVRADEERARELGIGGVPFFVIGRYGLSGAQPAEVLLEALHAARAERAPGAGGVDACTPQGCG